MRTKYILLIIFICICIVTFVISGLTYKVNILNDYKSIQDCTHESTDSCNGEEEHCCIIWDSNSKSCRKGIIQDGSCKWPNNIVPLIFALLALTSIVVIIIILLICLGEYVTGEKTIYQ